jgi:hypothetical protein
MSSILDFNLPSTGLSRAADDIIAQIKSIKDDNGNAIFSTVQRGVILPTHDEPRKETVPAARLWYEHVSHDIKNVQFYAQERFVHMGLYLYFYSFAKDEYGEPADLQDVCDRITTLTINYLKKNTSDPDSVGFSPSFGIWSWDVPQMVNVETTNALKKFSSNLVILPPWYVSRISFTIKVQNTSS